MPPRRKKTPAHAPPPAGEEHRYATRRYWAARYAAVGDGDVFEWFLSFDDLRPLLGFVKRRSSVLDLGCGTSRLLCDMREAGYAGRLVGVDCAAAALRSVKERSESCHVELVEADATTLAPFADATFDVVVDKGTVDALISGDAAAATEACAAAGRVLKRGGRFVVVSHRRPDGDDAGSRPCSRGSRRSTRPGASTRTRRPGRRFDVHEAPVGVQGSGARRPRVRIKQ